MLCTSHMIVKTCKSIFFVMNSLRSCHGRADKTSDFEARGDQFKPRPGSCALRQGTIISSLPSLSEETLSHLSRV